MCCPPPLHPLSSLLTATSIVFHPPLRLHSAPTPAPPPRPCQALHSRSARCFCSERHFRSCPLWYVLGAVLVGREVPLHCSYQLDHHCRPLAGRRHRKGHGIKVRLVPLRPNLLTASVSLTWGVRVFLRAAVRVRCVDAAVAPSPRELVELKRARDL